MDEKVESGLHIVIVGGGIIGCATAYFLTKLNKTCSVTVIERHKVAGSASGKAGGLLAAGWGSQETVEFHKKGFQIIEEIAEELDIKSYRKLKTWQLQWGPRVKKTAIPSCNWLKGRISNFSIMDRDTAQITPYDLTTRMLQAAIDTKRCKVIIGECKAVQRNERDTTRVKSVLVDDKEVMLDKLLVALGPWSVLCEKWFPGFKVPIAGIWSTSLTLRPKQKLQACSMFCNEDVNGCHLEIISRPNDEIHICGVGGGTVDGRKTLKGSELVNQAPEDVVANPKRVEAAMKSFKEISHLKVNQEDIISQACMRPYTNIDGLPMIGKIPKTSNTYIASGHNCWGILWSGVTGKVMAELMLTEKPPRTASIKNFDPARFS